MPSIRSSQRRINFIVALTLGKYIEGRDGAGHFRGKVSETQITEKH